MDKMELPLLKGEEKEKMIPFTVIVGLVILFIIFCITCLSLTFKGTYKLHYSETSNLDYRVYIKESEFYPNTKYLPKDKVYISSLIDYIDTDFYYTFKSDDDLALDYGYYVEAELLIDNMDGKNIYTETETLLEEDSIKNAVDNNFKISENLKIDYNRWNQMATSYIDTYGLTAEAKLNVSLYVDVIGSHAEFDKKISDKAAITLTIPLSMRTLEISMDYDLSNNYDETLQYRSTIINIPFLFYTCIVLAILDLIAMIVIIAWIILTRDANTLYKKKLAKILRDYDKYVSETVITQRVEDMMKTKSLRIEVVKSFQGLIDIRDNLGVPILYHEERPGQEAVFYIVTERIGYIYVMRAEDLKKDKKKVKNELKEPLKETKKKTKKNEEINDVLVEKINLEELVPEPDEVMELNEDIPEEITEDDIRKAESLIVENYGVFNSEIENEVVETVSESVDAVKEKSDILLEEIENPVQEETNDSVKEENTHEKSAKAKAREKNQRYYKNTRKSKKRSK